MGETQYVWIHDQDDFVRYQQQKDIGSKTKGELIDIIEQQNQEIKLLKTAAYVAKEALQKVTL